MENYVDWHIDWWRKSIERDKHEIEVYVKQGNWKMVIVIAKELEKGILEKIAEYQLKVLENAKEVMECQSLVENV